MEKEKVTLYHATFPRNREFILLHLRKEYFYDHFAIIACNESHIENDSLDIYRTYKDYTLKEISVEDLPLFLDWNKKPIFSKFLKGETTPELMPSSLLFIGKHKEPWTNMKCK